MANCSIPANVLNSDAEVPNCTIIQFVSVLNSNNTLVVVVGVSLLIMVIIISCQWLRDCFLRLYRSYLPSSSLKRLVAGDEPLYDGSCCICLDQFVVGDGLRVLPCSHTYHARCIDPWLLKHCRMCPQCRKMVFTEGDRDNQSSQLMAENEGTPLL